MSKQKNNVITTVSTVKGMILWYSAFLYGGKFFSIDAKWNTFIQYQHDRNIHILDTEKSLMVAAS